MLSWEEIMPKRAHYLLIWSVEDGRYELRERDRDTRDPLQEGDGWWFAWLAKQRSFAFQGKQGHVTLLKEARERGSDYWYAYRSQNRRTNKKYAGRTADLTVAHLEELAGAFTNEATPQARGVPVQTRASVLPQHPDRPFIVAEPSAALSETLQLVQPASQPHANVLLEPKLRSPRLQAALVAREHLWTKLDAGLQCKLILLCAPAGFGKTTLVGQWLNERRTHTQLPQVAWIALDSGDNDPLRFWRYLITACQSFHPHGSHASLALLSPALLPSFELPSLETVLTSFLNELARSASAGVLVLEDYHLITEAHIHETLLFFLDHLPPNIHMVMLTRSEPPFPLVRWRARGELCEVQATDLRFSLEETESFFQRTLDSLQPASFSDGFLSQVNQHVEGWAAGLRLLALTLQGSSQQQGREHVLMNFAGDQRLLQEYFVTEVLNAQPQELQDFLLRTSILSSLTGSLCDAVAERQESEHLLESVKRAGLFLESLDGSGTWYRYHALFAEAMRASARHRLGSEAVRSLYLRASRWYEQEGLHAEAIEVAFQAQHAERAAMLIEHLFETSENFVFGKSIFQKAPEFHTLRRWLEQLPEEILSTRPLLCLGYAESILFVFVLQQSAPDLVAMKQLAKALQMAEDGWRREGNQLRLGEIFAFRALTLRQLGAMREAVNYARQALALLPADAVEGRMMSLWFVGMGEVQEGDLNRALEAFLEVQAFCEVLEHAAIKRANTVWLSGLYYARGELQQAAESFHQLLIEARAVEDIDDICDALLGLAQLSYEWNELTTAEQQVREALELARQLANYELQVQATLILARIEHARGEIPEAQRRCVSQLASLPAILPQRARLAREIQVMQARLALTQSDFAALERWWISLAPFDELPHSLRDREALLRAGWLLHQEQAQDALDLLEKMVQDAQAEGRTGTVWEILLLTALANAALKRLPAARKQLQELLEHVHAAGYMRLFLDEGEPLAALLQSILPTVRGNVQRVALKRLLLAFAQQRAASGHSSKDATLAEPLSTQEQRVLSLLAAGHSNPEIAQTLVVTVNTIKAQIRSIYRKLNVTNRVEACEVARMLNLL